MLRGFPDQPRGDCIEVDAGHCGEELHGIRHQTVAEDGETVRLRLGSENVDVEPPVFVEPAGLLAVGAPSDDVVRNALRNDMSVTRQDGCGEIGACQRL